MDRERLGQRRQRQHPRCGSADPSAHLQRYRQRQARHEQHSARCLHHAITCDGAAIPNYAIHYAKGSLTVNPVADPQGTALVEGTVTVDDGRSSTRSRHVQLSLAATNAGTGVTQMRFSNDGSSWSAYRPYAATAAWSLSGADGTKTVYAQFADDIRQLLRRGQ